MTLSSSITMSDWILPASAYTQQYLWYDLAGKVGSNSPLTLSATFADRSASLDVCFLRHGVPTCGAGSSLDKSLKIPSDAGAIGFRVNPGQVGADFTRVVTSVSLEADYDRTKTVPLGSFVTHRPAS